ncbi:MAG: hypothetical protein V8S08_10630 [Lachnoclostridium sp.]
MEIIAAGIIDTFVDGKGFPVFYGTEGSAAVRTSQLKTRRSNLLSGFEGL